MPNHDHLPKPYLNYSVFMYASPLTTLTPKPLTLNPLTPHPNYSVFMHIDSEL